MLCNLVSNIPHRMLKYLSLNKSKKKKRKSTTKKKKKKIIFCHEKMHSNKGSDLEVIWYLGPSHRAFQIAMINF